MLERFLKYISDNLLCGKQDSILLSISGGIDSLVMTDLFIQAGFNVAMAHCNFKLRGKEADEDEEFVHDYAMNRKVTFYHKSFNTLEFAEENKYSIQMAARELRINWLEEIVSEEKFCCYATAHHLDDQIETLFLNLLRGTGISGIRGLLPRQGNVIHPLLFATKSDIISYGKNNEIDFREDASNRETDYLRNKIRHFIIPQIEKIDPGYRSAFNRSIENFKQVEKIYRYQIDSWIKDIIEKQSGNLTVSIEKLKKLPFITNCIYEIIKPLQFNYQDAVDIFQGLDSQSGKIFYSSTHRIVKDRDQLYIEKISDTDNVPVFIDQNAEKTAWPVELEINRFEKTSDFHIPVDKTIVCFDSSKLEYPMKIRKWEKGDYFYPLGLKGKKLISDYYIDEKISLPVKEKTFLLFSGNEIVWVIGQRIDERFKITDDTRHITRFRMV